MMRLIIDKHLTSDENSVLNEVNTREVAAVKCIIDFRIAYYELIGRSVAKYIDAAIELHKRLTNNKIITMNRIIKQWMSR